MNSNAMKYYAARKGALALRDRPAAVDALEAEGVEALNNGDTRKALAAFEEAEKLYPDAVTRSYLAYCLAAENQEFRRSMSMAIQALREDPMNPQLYLNLGRIQVLSGRKRDAVRMFLKGQSCERKVRRSIFHDELVMLGIRKKPPIPFLSRSNSANKYIGLVLSRLRKIQKRRRKMETSRRRNKKV